MHIINEEGKLSTPIFLSYLQVSMQLNRQTSVYSNPFKVINQLKELPIYSRDFVERRSCLKLWTIFENRSLIQLDTSWVDHTDFFHFKRNIDLLFESQPSRGKISWNGIVFFPEQQFLMQYFFFCLDFNDKIAFLMDTNA